MNSLVYVMKILLLFSLLFLFEQNLLADTTAPTDLKITKSVSTGTVEVNQNYTYTLHVQNVDPSVTANDVKVTDSLPTGVYQQSISASGWDCSASTTSYIDCRVATMDPGVSSDIVVTVKSNASGTVDNTASVGSSSPEKTPSDNESSVSKTIISTENVDMKITKTSVTSVETDEQYRYTLKIENKSNSYAKNVTVTDVLPSGLTYVSKYGSGWSCSGTTSITCTYNDLFPPVSTRYVTIDVKAPHTPPSPNTVTNTANVTTTSTDTDSGNDNSSNTVTINQAPVKLDTHLNDSADPVNTGDDFYYYVRVDNDSYTVDADSIKVVTTLNSALSGSYSGYSGSGSNWSCNPISGDVVTCYYTTTLAPRNTTETLKLNVTAPGQGSYFNESSAYNTSTSASRYDRSDETTNVIDTSLPADVRLLKTASSSTINAGESFYFDINVKNLSSTNYSEEIKVVDPIPSGLTYIGKSGSYGGWSCGGTPLTCTSPSLSPGENKRLRLNVTAPDSLGSYTNTATVSSTTPDPDTSNNTDSVTVNTVVQDISNYLDAGKYPSEHIVEIDSDFTYVILTRNTFSHTVENVEFTDTLPNDVIFVAFGTQYNTSCSTNGATPPTITCNTASLDPGEEAYALIDVKAPSTTGTITNTVRVTSHSTTTNSDSTDSTDVEVINTTLDSDLSITKTATQTTLNTEDNFSYSLVVTNNSDNYIKNIEVNDTLPVDVDFRYFSSSNDPAWNCTQSAGDIHCGPLPVLSPHSSSTILIRVKAKDTRSEPNPIINTAYVGAETPDTNQVNNVSSANITIIDISQAADLRLWIYNDGQQTVDADSIFNRRIRIKNLDYTNTAYNLEVNITIPTEYSKRWNNSDYNGIAANVVYINADDSDPGWSCAITGNIVTCRLAELLKRKNTYIRIKQKAPSLPGIIFNHADVSHASIDTDTSNNSAKSSAHIAEAVLGVEKLCYEEPTYSGTCVDSGAQKAGAGCKQTIRVKNTFTRTIYDVELFINTSGYTTPYISECGYDGGHTSSCNKIYNDVNLSVAGMLDQAVKFNSPYSYRANSSHTIYTTASTNQALYNNNNLYARYYDGENHYGKITHCPLPEPDPGNEPNYRSCGVFPDILTGYINDTFGFPTPLSSNSFTDLTTSSLAGSDVQDYQYATVNVDSDVTFDPQRTYNDSSRTLMLIDKLNVNTDNVTLTFNEGNYYINTFTVTADNVTINTNGKVRFFVGGTSRSTFSVTGNGFSFNANSDPKDLYVFSTGDIVLNSGASGIFVVKGYFYSQQQITIIPNSSSSNIFAGAFTSEDAMNVSPKPFFTYIDTYLDAEGYGPCVNYHEGDRDFILINSKVSQNILGDIQTIGNSNTCISDNNSLTGHCLTTDNNEINDQSYVIYANIEADEGRNSITVDGASEVVHNSSGATISITTPTPDKNISVVWAGLFWQGSIHNWDNSFAAGNNVNLFGTKTASSINLSDPTQYGQHQVAFHTPNMSDGEYTLVSLNPLNSYYDFYPIYKTDYSGEDYNGGTYSVFTEITDIIKDQGIQNGPNGEYRIANLKTMQGFEKNLGNYGGWSLVIIYDNHSDPLQKFKNLSVYSGYKIISAVHSAATYIDVSGFRTPKNGLIDSTLSVFVGEGEAYDGDYGNIITPKGDFSLDDGLTTVSNLFNGRISGDTSALRQPNYPNTNGIDVRNFDVGTHMENEQRTATIELGTNKDTYFPSMVTFATELYKPDICYDYSIKQNGHFLPVDLPSNKIPDLNQSVLNGSNLEFNVFLRNREGDISATKLTLYTDFDAEPVLPVQMSYVPNSVWKSDVNGSYYYHYNDSDSVINPTATPNGVEIGIGTDPLSYNNGGSLSMQESQYIRFSTLARTSKLHMQFKLSLNMELKFNDDTRVPLNGFRLGPDIARCEPAVAYNPTWGQFTVVDHKLNEFVSNPADLRYNLRTQVSQRPYDVDIVSLKESTTNLDKTQTNHWEALEANTTVHIELADLMEFSDLNASCGDSFNAIPGTQEFVTFGTSDWKKPLSIKSTSYARPNLTYRVWFIEDLNNTLIHHNCGNPATSVNCYQTIYNDYFKANGDAYCESSCSISDSNCYECLRGKYGNALCSRDNFSIRPEAFYIEGLKDMNASGSTPYLLVPDSNNSTNTVTTHHIAARYPYRLDVNATGYCYTDSNQTSARGVPGYNNVFNSHTNISSFNWYENLADPVTCNDESDQNITLAFNNTPFSTSETLQSTSNIGRYIISLRDNTWTNVDKDSVALHHNNAETRNFFLGSTGNKNNDCKLNEIFVPRINHPYDSLTPTNERYIVGCDFASDYHKLDDNSSLCNPTPPYSINQHDFSDYNVTAHPHHIKLSLNDNNDVKEINNTSSTFIYMNSMIDNNESDKMSTYLDASFSAVAKDNSVLENFTQNCYAQGLDMEFNSTIWHYGGEHNVTYKVSAYDNADVKFIDFNSSANDINITDSLTTIQTTMLSNVHVTEKAFRDDMNGTANIKIYLNLDKNMTKPKNPFRVNFSDLNITCTQDYTNTLDNISDIMLDDCNYTVDGKSNTQGQDYILSDKNITFIFGRVHAPRYRVLGNDANITLFYEAYCSIQSGSETACKTLLRDLVSPDRKHSVNNVNWFINQAHTGNKDGNVSDITPVHANRVSTFLTDYNKAELKYDESRGYPYRSTMKINTSSWLMYNKFEDNNATANRFEVEFRQKGKRPSTAQGIGDDNGAVNSNRRIMW